MILDQGFVDDVVDPRHHGEEQDEVVAVGVELHRFVELRVGKEARGPRGGVLTGDLNFLA